MDIYRNVSVSGALSSEYQREKVVSPASSKLGGCSSSLEELFPGENMEGDINLEWLSIFVEDCLSSTTNYTPIPTTTHIQNPPPKTPRKPSLQGLVIPGKARTKRKRATPPIPKEAKLSNVSVVHQTEHVTTSDPPLLHHAYWLADSELIVYKKDQEKTAEDDAEGMGSLDDGSVGQPRRCTHCLSQKTPQWRAGPLGPKTLCNACGVRYKSGRLLPEYRPAKSPTFEIYKHSNSHKKVMEMRKSIIPSDPNQYLGMWCKERIKF